MNEYKREVQTLESELRDTRKRAGDADDHLRVVDAWWTQLLDEVTLLTRNDAPASYKLDTKFPTAALFKNNSDFSQHLSGKAKLIKEKITEIMGNLGAQQGEPSSQLQELRDKFTKLLASQKEEHVKFDRIRAELEQQTDRYANASLRALKAEKKLERLKSQSVQKLEQQAIAGTGNSAGSGIGGIENGFDSRSEMANGVTDDNKASRLALKEATAVSAKQKEQLDEIMKENGKLTEQLTAANVKLSNLTDEDYAQTNLFKNFKAQHEEVIKRINHLEATNIQLREEAEKLQAERTAYRTQVDEDARMIASGVDTQMRQMEEDLARLRGARDKLTDEQGTSKAEQEQERHANQHMKELVSAKEERINTLESEFKRMKAVVDGNLPPVAEIEDLDISDLRKKYAELQQNFESVNNELPGMETAYKRAVANSSKKVLDFAALEDKVGKLIAEKSKADQKYFAARKDMDIKMNEIRSLRAQNQKSSEIISALKDVDTRDKALIANLEKQLSDLKQSNYSIMHEQKKLQSSASDAMSRLESLKRQVEEMRKMLCAKDSSLHTSKERVHTLETELEKLRVKLEKVEKDKESWKKKSLSNQSGEEEDLRVSFPSLLFWNLPLTCLERNSRFALSAP